VRPRGGLALHRHRFTAAFAGITALYTYRSLSNDPWDDALFFERIGTNIVRHGVAAWNVADGPVHGNTSQLFQVVAAASVALAPGHYQLAIKMFLGVSLVIAFALLTWLIASRLLPRDRDDRLGPCGVLICGLSAPTIQLLGGSGMETLFVLAVLAGFLCVLAEVRSRRLDAAFACATVLVYLARPDAAILAIVTAAIVLADPRRGLRQSPRFFRLLLVALAAVALTLAGLRLYYGSAFPLSFYLKSRALTSYDAEYASLGNDGDTRQLLTWLIFSAPFIYIALFRLRQWTVGLLAGAAVFVAYHAFNTIGIMAYHTRYLVPASLPIVLAAAIAWPSFARDRGWLRRLPLLVGYPIALVYAYAHGAIEAHRVDFYLGWLSPFDYAAFAIPLLVLIASARLPRARADAVVAIVPIIALSCAAIAVPWRATPALDDATATRRMTSHLNSMTGIDDVKRCIAEPTNIYHSEIGVPGVLFPDSTVTDLTGLMNRRLAFERPRFDSYCLASPPDVLFLPHWTHARLNEDIAESRCIQLYARPHGIPESSSTLFIRRDLIARFDACTGRP